jgi:hypothetical protein
MHLRRSAAVLVAAAALASTGCQTKIEDRGLSQSVSLAVFDPAKSQIPLPNDLALLKASCPAADARMQLVCAMRAAGGFPADQEVAITFDFAHQALDASGAVVTDPVALDTTTVKVLGAVAPAAGPTVAVLDVTFAPTTIVPVPVEATFDVATSTLKLRKAAEADGTRRWTEGARYVAFVRGGASGVKTTSGDAIAPMPTMFILREAIVSDRDLTLPENQVLIPGTPAQKIESGKSLEQLRQVYKPLRALYEHPKLGLGSFADVANLLTFHIAPKRVMVEVDPIKGSAPLPIDLLRATDAAGGRILDNPAYGAARAGIVTLDGFSTTAPITAPLTVGSAPGVLDAGTINGANVFLFEIDTATSTTTVRQLKELKHALATGGTAAAATADYVAQPTGTFLPSGASGCPTRIAGGCASSLVLQPAVAVPAYGAFLPPLKGGTKYAVVVTNRVKDLDGVGMGRSTVAQMLLSLTAPLDATVGLDAVTAARLTQMRSDLAPVLAALPAGTTTADVAMAYVFKTQSVTSASLSLSALPYKVEATVGAAAFSPKLVTTVTDSFPDVTGAAAIYEVVVPTVDVTSHVTGTLDPAILASAAAIASHITPLKALVAVPAGVTGARPLVVYGHGLKSSKESLLVPATKQLPGTTPAVNALLAKGFIVAAIDFPQHGSRAWCLKDSDCATGTCVAFTTPTGAPAYQGDVDTSSGTPVPVAPGTCSNRDPLPAASGQTFVSQNFFRTRDLFRQNVLDQSALVLALARPPTAPQPAANPLAKALQDLGLAVHPAEIYWEGISLGGIAGTQVLATNPRFSRGVTSVAGGTLVDVFTHSNSFAPYLVPLFTGLLKDQLGGSAFDPAMLNPASASYRPDVAAAYGKTLLVAKWILDPGDALNYARHVKLAPLPNLLANPSGATPQAAKAVLGQIATNDQTIPNDSNRELFVNGGFDTVTYTTSQYPDGAMHSILGFQPRVQADAAAYLEAQTMPTAPYSIP